MTIRALGGARHKSGSAMIRFYRCKATGIHTNEENEMKKMIGILILVLPLFGCNDSDVGTASERNFIGSWTQINTGNAPVMDATISKADNGYVVEIRLPLPNQAPVVVTKPGKLKDGMLVADDLEKIRFIASTGHLMIGANEFEMKK